MGRVFVVALVITTGCWSSAARAPAPIANEVRPSTVRVGPREPAVAEFGTFDDMGAIQVTLDVPLYNGSMFGWRIKLPCTDPVTVYEQLRLPAEGDWGIDPDIVVSADKRSATVSSTAVCTDGWIEKIWSAAPNDPPGMWELEVSVEGFATQIFRPTFVQAPQP